MASLMALDDIMRPWSPSDAWVGGVAPNIRGGVEVTRRHARGRGVCELVLNTDRANKPGGSTQPLRAQNTTAHWPSHRVHRGSHEPQASTVACHNKACPTTRLPPFAPSCASERLQQANSPTYLKAAAGINSHSI